MNDDRHRNLYENPLRCLFWWYDPLEISMMGPSNSVLVFLREGMGVRLMQPWIFGIMFVFLWFCGTGGVAASTLFSGGTNGAAINGTPLLLFALAMGALAIYHRRKGKELFFRPIDPVHTFSRGNSHLAKVLPFPEWIIQRYIEPALVGLLGLFMIWPLHWFGLGLWVCLSSICLSGIEALVVSEAQNKVYDAGDIAIEAGYMRAIDNAIKSRRTPAHNEKKGGLAMTSPEVLRLRKQRLQDEAAQEEQRLALAAQEGVSTAALAARYISSEQEPEQARASNGRA